jgi:hypothetical protein
MSKISKSRPVSRPQSKSAPKPPASTNSATKTQGNAAEARTAGEKRSKDSVEISKEAAGPESKPSQPRDVQDVPPGDDGGTETNPGDPPTPDPEKGGFEALLEELKGMFDDLKDEIRNSQAQQPSGGGECGGGGGDQGGGGSCGGCGKAGGASPMGGAAGQNPLQDLVKSLFKVENAKNPAEKAAALKDLEQKYMQIKASGQQLDPMIEQRIVQVLQGAGSGSGNASAGIGGILANLGFQPNGAGMAGVPAAANFGSGGMVVAVMGAGRF